MILFTQLKTRLTRIQSNSEKPYNWLFLPGGPGLGSESLQPLTNILDLPGSVWHVDLPDDGSNIVSDSTFYFEHWQQALIQAAQEFEDVILVAHSTGAMYALATPQLKNILRGFIIMDSAPDASWQHSFIEYVRMNPIPKLQHLQKEYDNQPTNENLKKVTCAALAYLFTPHGLQKDLTFFNTLPYNARACQWSAENFDHTYKALWVPDTLPTLIFAGDHDHLTPLKLFRDNPAFDYQNITMVEIHNSGHYPWIENSKQVTLAFENYAQKLRFE